MIRMKFIGFCLFPVAALLFQSGCSSGERDSLAREKASMEAEAKALAAHKIDPTTVKPVDKSGGGTSAMSQPSGPASQRVPPGTLVKIITMQSLSTRTATTGEVWTGKLAEDLKDSAGKVVAQAGSEVKGRVVLASDGSNLRRKHELEVRLYRLNAVSGAPVDIRTTSFVRPGADEGKRPAIIESQMTIEFQLASEAVFP